MFGGLVDTATDVGGDITEGAGDAWDAGTDAGADFVGGLTGGSSGSDSSSEDNIDTPDYSTEVEPPGEHPETDEQDTGGTDRWQSRSESRTPSSNNQATLSGLPIGALVIGGLLAVLFIMEVSN